MTVVIDELAPFIERISNSPLMPVIEDYIDKNVKNLILSIYEDVYQEKDIKETWIFLKRDSFNRTKRRWAGNAIRDYETKDNKQKKELYGEYLLLCTYFDTYGTKRFQEKFEGFLTPEDYIQVQIERLREWSEDDGKLLTEYPYLSNKTKTQISKAIRIDLSMLLGEWLVTGGKSVNQIIESPFSTVENPFFSNRRGALKLDNELLVQGQKEYLLSSYKVNDEADYLLMVEKEYAADNSHRVNDLDQTDYKIFLEVMSYRDSLFATQKVITVKLGDIVRNIYSSDGKNNYKSLEERLAKMKAYSMTKVLQNGTKTTFGIFDTIEYPPELTGGIRTANIYVNEMIYREYIQRQTVRIYKTKLEKLTTDSARHLIFILQKERLICYETNATYTVSRDYLYFATRVRFKKRRKSDNLKEIQEALDDLIQQSIVVKSYKRTRDMFQIEFFPIDEQEVKDIVQGNFEYNPLERSNTPSIS